MKESFSFFSFLSSSFFFSFLLFLKKKKKKSNTNRSCTSIYIVTETYIYMCVWTKSLNDKHVSESKQWYVFWGQCTMVCVRACVRACVFVRFVSFRLFAVVSTVDFKSDCGSRQVEQKTIVIYKGEGTRVAHHVQRWGEGWGGRGGGRGHALQQLKSRNKTLLKVWIRTEWMSWDSLERLQ